MYLYSSFVHLTDTLLESSNSLSVTSANHLVKATEERDQTHTRAAPIPVESKNKILYAGAEFIVDQYEREPAVTSRDDAMTITPKNPLKAKMHKDKGSAFKEKDNGPQYTSHEQMGAAISMSNTVNVPLSDMDEEDDTEEDYLGATDDTDKENLGIFIRGSMQETESKDFSTMHQTLTVLYSRSREDLMKGGSYCDQFKVNTDEMGNLAGRSVVEAFHKDNPELDVSKCTFRMSLTQSGFHMLDPEHTFPIDRGR